jgi:hypothetical protein
MSLQGLFDFREQVIAAEQKLDRFIEFIQYIAQSVFQRPCEGYDALRGDFHPTIVPWM